MKLRTPARVLVTGAVAVAGIIGMAWLSAIAVSGIRDNDTRIVMNIVMGALSGVPIGLWVYLTWEWLGQ